MRTVFLRVLEADDKAAALLAAICEPALAQPQRRFEVDRESFSAVPRSPLAYWAGPTVLDCYRRFPRFEEDGRIARITNPVGDNNRFVRMWWEPSIGGRTLAQPRNHVWVPLSKGGDFAHFKDERNILFRGKEKKRNYDE